MRTVVPRTRLRMFRGAFAGAVGSSEVPPAVVGSCREDLEGVLGALDRIRRGMGEECGMVVEVRLRTAHVRTGPEKKTTPLGLFLAVAVRYFV